MYICYLIFFFFFSSRRRHTRWPRDWSSDVCSSDLKSNVEYRKSCRRSNPCPDHRRRGLLPLQERQLRRLDERPTLADVANAGLAVVPRTRRDRKSVV